MRTCRLREGCYFGSQMMGGLECPIIILCNDGMLIFGCIIGLLLNRSHSANAQGQDVDTTVPPLLRLPAFFISSVAGPLHAMSTAIHPATTAPSVLLCEGSLLKQRGISGFVHGAFTVVSDKRCEDLRDANQRKSKEHNVCHLQALSRIKRR